MSETKVARKKYGKPTKKADFKKLSISVTDKATRRVIAPYVNIVRRGRKAAVQQETDNKFFSFYLQKKPSVLMRQLTEFLSDTVDLHLLLHESADALKCITNAVGVRVYMVDDSANEIYVSPRQLTNPRNRVSWRIEEGKSLAAYVACKREFILVDDILGDARFPDGIPYTDPTIKSVLCVPIVTPDNECFAVLELYRDVLQPVFQRADLKIVVVVAGWMGASIHQNQQRVALLRQQQLNDCLIELTKCYFSDTVLLEKMITEVVNFAKTTVNAERASFFVIDRDKDELVADIFDEGLDVTDTSGYIKRNTKIRFGKERGIAGLVAKTGVHINVKDAYNDSRFNKDVDQKTGFITRSILCMPVMGVNGILGVVQAINKINAPCFTKQDENIFKTFSVYCALALHYSEISKNRLKSDASHQIVLALLKRHLSPCVHELEWTRQNMEFEETVENLREFSWYITPDLVDKMPQIGVFMIKEICGEDGVVMEELINFVLIMRKFYRKNPYHNWEHAFNVCHCMYNLLLRNTDIFSVLELKALIVAAIGHDVDHGGVTNNFLNITNDVIAQLYDESPWENHHYQVTMIILSEVHVYKDLSEEDFKIVSQFIKEAILATDLATYFKIRAKLTPIIIDDAFDWSLPAHRLMVKSIMMTVSDLSGQCKPFEVAKKITDILYKEFYCQGDNEKNMGLVPLSMMDREKQYMIPDDQVQFLNVLVLPCCDLLRKLLPNTENLYYDATSLRDAWVHIIQIRNEKCWKQEASVVH